MPDPPSPGPPTTEPTAKGEMSAGHESRLLQPVAYFNAPAVSPLTMRRCRNMYNTMTGATNTVAKASASDQSA